MICGKRTRGSALFNCSSFNRGNGKRLTGDMAERHKDEIVLHNIDSYAVQLLIEYSYTGDVKITEDNVQVGFCHRHNGTTTGMMSLFARLMTCGICARLGASEALLTDEFISA